MMKNTLCLLMCLLLTFSILEISTAAENSSIVFSKNEDATKKIALTFDDGPHPRYTERILNILEKYNIKATFFVIGVNIENYPEPLKKIYEGGHEIGNHSYDHNNEKNLNEENVRTEIEKCETLIYETVGVRATLFRPPQGDYGSQVEKIASQKNYSIILWSIDTRDWEHSPPQKILKTVSSKLNGGDIILMHDYVSGTNTTCEALELIIPTLLSQGYEFVTVSELING